MNEQAPNSFEVTLARSGGTYVVPENQSIVDVLAKHGILVEVSCEQGVCGTCMTGVYQAFLSTKICT